MNCLLKKGPRSEQNHQIVHSLKKKKAIALKQRYHAPSIVYMPIVYHCFTANLMALQF